ncbi:MAG: hypothetical protein ACTHJJ_04130 [Intrasporangium sp.]|uniref:hypothetical protein n=1 Tax=Intrasporangium sp. TaxID=1925024 RepID=UPI003F7FA6F3
MNTSTMVPFPDALAHQLIAERTAERTRRYPVRRHSRTAHLLRRLAQHFDPVPEVRTPAPRPVHVDRNARQPRPWTAVRRGPHASRH